MAARGRGAGSFPETSSIVVRCRRGSAAVDQRRESATPYQFVRAILPGALTAHRPWQTAASPATPQAPPDPPPRNATTTARMVSLHVGEHTDLCASSAAAEQATSTWRLRAHGLAVGNLALGPYAMWVQMQKPARRRTPVHRLVDCWESCQLAAGEVAPPGITERRAIDGPTDPAPRSH